MKSRAEESGITPQKAQADFAAIRQISGIRAYKAGAKKAGLKKSAATVKETYAQGNASDSDLTEFESDNEQ